MSEAKSYTFQVRGMHCSACVLLTENELEALPYINKARANLQTCSVEVEGSFGTATVESIAVSLSRSLEPHGYSLMIENKVETIAWREFKVALPSAIIVIVLFLLLQKLGIVNFITIAKVNYGTAFIIGIIASLSTCMAIVGGLVLSMSATMAKEGDKVKPQLLFHIGRLISFFVLGGVIGLIGARFEPGIVGTFIISLIIGLVMLLLGLNLLDIFVWSKRLQPTLPRFISKQLLTVKKFNHQVTPLLLGTVTFFVPCGFTQSMQIYSLSTHSFLTSALTMTAFALGTLPILALLSFTSLTIKQAKMGIFFKTMGLITIFFALFNIYTSLVAIGLFPSFLNF